MKQQSLLTLFTIPNGQFIDGSTTRTYHNLVTYNTWRGLEIRTHMKTAKLLATLAVKDINIAVSIGCKYKALVFFIQE